MKNKYILLVIFYLFLMVSLKAQTNDPPLRIEIEIEKDSYPIHIVPMASEGVLLIREQDDYGTSLKKLQMILYDTNFYKQNTINSSIPIDYEYKTYQYQQDEIYILYQKKSSKKDNGKILILKYSIHTSDVVYKEYEGCGDFSVYELKKLNSNFLLSIAISQESEKLVWVNFETDSLYFIDFNLPVDYVIEMMEYNAIDNNYVTAIKMMSKEDYSLLIYTIDSTMSIHHLYTLPDTDHLIYNSVRMAKIDTSLIILTGTYNNYQKKKQNIHTGIYHIEIRNGQMKNLKLIPFSQLQTSSQTFRYDNSNLRILLGNVVRSDSQYVFLADVYYPEYAQTESGAFSDISYGRYYPTFPSEEFNGFRYVNAYIVCMDTNGHIKWKMDYPYNLITQSLKPRIQTYLDGNDAIVYYVYASRLNYTTIINRQPNGMKDNIQIESLYFGDQIQYNREVEFEHWYHHNFIYSSYQYIKNDGRIHKGKRYVFCMNKLAFQ